MAKTESPRRGRPVTPGLTDTEKNYLRTIRQLMKSSPMPPTVQEIADAMGVSRPTAHEYLGRLQQKGVLNRQGRRNRSLVIVRRPAARQARKTA